MNNNRFISAVLLSCVFVSISYTYQYSVAEFVDVHGNIRKYVNVSPAVVRARTREGRPVSDEFRNFVHNDPMMQEAVKARLNKAGANRVSLSAAALQTNVTNDLCQEGNNLKEQADSYAAKASLAKWAAGLGATTLFVGGIIAISSNGSDGKVLGVGGAVLGGVVGGSGLAWLWSNADAQEDIKDAIVQNTAETKIWKDRFTVVDDRDMRGK